MPPQAIGADIYQRAWISAPSNGAAPACGEAAGELCCKFILFNSHAHGQVSGGKFVYPEFDLPQPKRVERQEYIDAQRLLELYRSDNGKLWLDRRGSELLMMMHMFLTKTDPKDTAAVAYLQGRMAQIWVELQEPERFQNMLRQVADAEAEVDLAGPAKRRFGFLRSLWEHLADRMDRR